MLKETLDCHDQISSGIRFQHVSANTSFKDVMHNLLRLVHGKDKHFGPRQRAQDTAGSFQTVHNRHGDVEYDNVRLQSAGEPEGLTAVFGLAAHFPTRSCLDQGSQTSTYDVVVVGH